MATQKKLAWGILGTGRIARKLADSVRRSQLGRLVGVGSRSQASADQFAKDFEVPNAYGTYDALLTDKAVEAVYISLPHTMHAEWTIKCAEAGKHVLCEKPFTTNYGEAMRALEACRAHDVFFMEAFMYRCHPQTQQVVDLIKSGTIGDVRLVQCNFAFRMGNRSPEGEFRLQNKMAGGGIVDVGAYTASMARLVAGAASGKDFLNPIEFKCVGKLRAEDPIDEWTSGVMKFENNVIATVTCGIQCEVDNKVRIFGTEGSIEINTPWFAGTGDGPHLVLRLYSAKAPQPISVKAPELYAIEVDTVAQYIDRRECPSPSMTWKDTLGNMQTLDMWRREVGLVYAPETEEGLKRTVTGRPLAPRKNHGMPFDRVEGIDKPISKVVMGSMALDLGNMPYTCAMLDDFVERGGNCIDTAYVYGGGRCEQAVGKWFKIRNNRKDIILIGKGAHTPNCTVEGITRELMITLDRLQSDYVDLYFMHRDNLDVPVGEFVDVLNEHKKAGRIRGFGGSNWSIERTEAANAYAKSKGLTGMCATSNNFALAVWNEPMWAGCTSVSDAKSKAWYVKNKFPNFCWSSQASGFFAEPKLDPTNWAHKDIIRTWHNDGNFKRLERAKELAKKYKVTPISIAFAYVMCQSWPAFALIGPRSIEETRTSLDGLGIKLSADELAYLNLEK